MKSDFCVAVHGLVYLAHRAQVLSSEELAKNICTNAARVRKVLAALKTAGLVETHEGSEGGYRFCAEKAQVTLAQVARAIDARFVAVNWHSGSTDCDCMISSGMGDVMDELLDDLNQTCLARLEQRTLADLEAALFAHSGERPLPPHEERNE